MDWTPRQKWWLNFVMVALQGLMTMSWGAFDINPHYIVAGVQVIAYIHILLNFMISGAVPPVNGGQNAQVANPNLGGPGGTGLRG